MLTSSRTALTAFALIAVLAMAPVAPEAANVLFLISGIVGFGFLVRSGGAAIRRPVVWMPLSALLLIAIAYVIGSGSVDGLIGLAYFAPVLAIYPLVAAGDEPGFEAVDLVGVLGLVSVAGAAVMVSIEVAETGTTRAGEIIANPIHFADVALLVGFLACAGMLRPGGKWRFIYALAPVFASVAVMLSGSRGPMVAVAVMLGVAGSVALITRLVSLKWAIGAVVAVIVLGIVGAFAGVQQLSGVQRVLADISDVLRVGMPTDASTGIRLQMLTGGWKAFLESPVFGHGPLEFVRVANSLVEVPFGEAPHLHSDPADFAASGGLIGLMAYLLFLAAPVVEVLRLPRGVARAQLMVLVSALVAGYFVMGLTNAMFGILNVTTCYAAVCLVTGLLASSVVRANETVVG
ncbi:O-antigen ligase family protein [Devosia sp. BK]|uniref:O-antigen ligase family protein n=1 Tax=Devosia sp. BK TaxID=2871706 RepID=UPI00293B8663|nr:O-antigen ligase family protein [Devosia sp. BK]MDV3249934.1 O-antigen ligase family protein [Devosia sp. BK]